MSLAVLTAADFEADRDRENCHSSDAVCLKIKHFIATISSQRRF